MGLQKEKIFLVLIFYQSDIRSPVTWEKDKEVFKNKAKCQMLLKEKKIRKTKLEIQI